MGDRREDPATSRLDNFVDAAFAFALTMLVVAGAEPTFSYPDLLDAMRRIPAFAVGFALIGLFWFAHVSWRRAGGQNDGLSIILSLALVLAVLVYVYPMRLMTAAFVGFLTSGQVPSGISKQGLFTIYGVGFAAMAGLVWGLFAHARRSAQLAKGYNAAPAIWGLLALAGALSALLAQFQATMLLAPWVYASLSLAVPLVLRFHRSRGRPPTLTE